MFSCFTFLAIVHSSISVSVLFFRSCCRSPTLFYPIFCIPILSFFFWFLPSFFLRFSHFLSSILKSPLRPSFDFRFFSPSSIAISGIIATAISLPRFLSFLYLSLSYFRAISLSLSLSLFVILFLAFSTPFLRSFFLKLSLILPLRFLLLLPRRTILASFPELTHSFSLFFSLFLLRFGLLIVLSHILLFSSLELPISLSPVSLVTAFPSTYSHLIPFFPSFLLLFLLSFSWNFSDLPLARSHILFNSLSSSFRRALTDILLPLFFLDFSLLSPTTALFSLLRLLSLFSALSPIFRSFLVNSYLHFFPIFYCHHAPSLFNRIFSRIPCFVLTA